jgi:hypothetical protein
MRRALLIGLPLVLVLAGLNMVGAADFYVIAGGKTAALPGYFSKLKINNNSSNPTTAIDVAADALAVSDGTSSKLITTLSLTINSAIIGENGLDTGVLANQTWYYIYVIAKADGTKAGLISTSATAPAMPAGYTYKKLVGAVTTDAASQFLPFNQWGNKVYYANGLNDADDHTQAYTVLNHGTARTWTEVPLSKYVPPDMAQAVLLGNEATLLPQLGPASGFISYDGTSTYFDIAVENRSSPTRAGCQVIVPLVISQTIYYKTTATDYSMAVMGFELSI